MQKTPLLILLLVFCLPFGLLAQISPPGLGKANTASWLALGVRQWMDSSHTQQSVTYICFCRISNPDYYDPLKKRAILVINEEYHHQFKKHWQYSLALSYRRQNEYATFAPYEAEDPAIKHEFRLYARLTNVQKNDKWKLNSTLRQEFRKFFDPSFHNHEENFQFRSRLREQVGYKLNKKHQLVLSAEALFSVSKLEKEWNAFEYRESRFCLYHSYSPTTLPFVFNLGYMYNLIGNKALNSVHYIALDVVWEKSFKQAKKETKQLQEYLE